MQILLVDEANDEIDPAEDIIIQSLNYFFSDNYRSIVCSAKYISSFLHGSSTLAILLGTIFIRSMMVKHADNIRTDNCKSHQARLSIIGILVAVFIFTFCMGVIIVLILYPLSPFDFVLARSCRGLAISYSEIEKRKIMEGWLARLVSLAVFTIAILSCHVRIIRFKRHHNMSYFSQFRQNIVTVDQTLAAAYLKIALAVFRETIFLSIINSSTSMIKDENFIKISNFLNCIAIPCYWIYSTKKDFKEYWSKETVFLRNILPRTEVAPLQINTVYSSEHKSSSAIQPRGPHIHEKSFMGDISQPVSESRLPGKFAHGLKF